jgi:hypothetical protein
MVNRRSIGRWGDGLSLRAGRVQPGTFGFRNFREDLFGGGAEGATGELPSQATDSSSTLVR